MRDQYKKRWRMNIISNTLCPTTTLFIIFQLMVLLTSLAFMTTPNTLIIDKSNLKEVILFVHIS